jgi:hypothetical protein
MRFLALLLLLVGLAACNSEEDAATVVSCQQLAQRSVRWQEPKVAVWSYQGATNGYHYFHFVDLPFGHYEQYKVAEDEMHIVAPFPFTTDQKKWRFLPWGPARVQAEEKGIPHNVCGDVYFLD